MASKTLSPSRDARLSGSDIGSIGPLAATDLPRAIRRPRGRIPGGLQAREGQSITEIAGASGLTVRALRYYEELGLLKPERTRGNCRIYSGAIVERVRLIADLRSAGIPLTVIDAACRGRNLVAPDKALADAIDVQLRRVEQQRQALLILSQALASVPSEP